MAASKPNCSAGKNIAMKVPAKDFESTVYFYQHVLGFETVDIDSPDNFDSVAFAFGSMHLWIDKIDSIDKAEIWLEIDTDNYQKTAQYLEQQGVERCDEVEPLPADFKGCWIKNPAGIVHLLNQRELNS